MAYIDKKEKDDTDKKGKLESIVDKTIGICKNAIDIYQNNRMININMNILAASVPSIYAAGKISSLMQNHGYTEKSIAIAAILTDWLLYLPVNTYMHYKTNKDQFIKKSDNTFDKKEFVKDLAKVYTTMIPSIVLFYAVAGPLHYYLMTKKISAGLANQLSYWGTLLTTRAVHIAVGMKTGLFEKKSLTE